MGKEPLTRSSIEFFIGLVLAIVLVVFPMTFYWKIFLLIVFGMIVVHLIDRSPKTYTLSKTIKGILSILAIIILASLSWYPVKEQWSKDHLTSDLLPLEKKDRTLGTSLLTLRCGAY